MDRTSFGEACGLLTHAKAELGRFSHTNWTNRWNARIAELEAAIDYTEAEWSEMEDLGYEVPF